MIFNSGAVRVLPKPQGSSRKGLKMYGFEKVVKGQYISQGNKIIEIGKKFKWVGNILWSPIGKVHTKYLYDAFNENDFIYVLNQDKMELSYRVKMVDLKEDYYEGLDGDGSPGYTIRIRLEGQELENQAGYGALGLSEGYGTGYGTDYGNQ